MRDIRFRGKRKNGNEFLIGDLNVIDGLTYVFDRSQEAPLNSTDWFEINSYTVGQFTGFIHKGKELFDGDIMKYTFENGEVDFLPIFWSDNSGAWVIGVKDEELLAEDLNCDIFEMELVGNIHQHPELLKSN